MSSEGKYILAVDVGTTTIRAHVYNSKAEIVGESNQKLKLEQLSQGRVEILPDSVWNQFTTTVKEAIHASDVDIKSIAALGLSTQRATLLTWNKKTGKPYHNFITWNDTRCANRTANINKSWSLKALKVGASLLYLLTCGGRRWETASVFNFSTQHVTMRLGWVIENIPNVKEDISRGEVCMGTLDTWLVWKLTEGKVHATDYSNISSTGLYDVFKPGWNNVHMGYLRLPVSIMPELKDTNGDFGCCHRDIFGEEIPIRAVIADQQAAMFGQCCFEEGDIKVTMGTGTFLVINTGSRASVPYDGAYPLVGWSIDGNITYLMECNDADTGTVIEWGMQMGFYEDPGQTESIAESVENSEGVCFVPAFQGIQAPVNDDTACASLLGVTRQTKQGHIVRSMLESLAFRIVQLHKLGREKCRTDIQPTISVDGGVSRNSFLCNLISGLTECPVQRPTNLQMSCLGAAFLAGLSSGVWKSTEELKKLRKVDQTFDSPSLKKSYQSQFTSWEKAVGRSLYWYRESKKGK